MDVGAPATPATSAASNNNPHLHRQHHHHKTPSSQHNIPRDAQTLRNLTATTTTTTIIGNYALCKTLGKGNFSTVKLAQHRLTKHQVAIKIINVSALCDDNLKKISREIEIMKKLEKSEHIVTLYQIIKTKRYFMLVMEYCEDGDLFEYIIQNGRLKEPKAYEYFKQMLSAVCFLHARNIVHRDLKAENILLTNKRASVMLADFGFANNFSASGDKMLDTWCGSPPYAAPELFKRIKYLGPEVDIWSLGVILYVLVCGSLPFDGPNLGYLQDRVLSGKFRVPFFMSSECELLIRGMLRLDPDRRFTSNQIKAHAWINRFDAPPPASLPASAAKPTAPSPGAGIASDLSLAPRHKLHEELASGAKHLVTQASTAGETSGSKSPSLADSSRGKSLDLDARRAIQQQRQQLQLQKDRSQHQEPRHPENDSNDNNSNNKSNNHMMANSNSPDSLVSSLRGFVSRFISDSKRQLQSVHTECISKLKQSPTTTITASGRNGTSGDSSIVKNSIDVDTDMATAVSNLSLEAGGQQSTCNSAGNNNWLSVTMSSADDDTADDQQQQQPQARQQTKQQADDNCTSGSNNKKHNARIEAGTWREFGRQSSLDDKILDYMVRELRVASSQLAVKAAIENNTFDDLHAIYRLLKDQPQQMLEHFAASAHQFKLPPALLARDQAGAAIVGSRLFSITSGFARPGGAAEEQESCIANSSGDASLLKRAPICTETAPLPQLSLLPSKKQAQAANDSDDSSPTQAPVSSQLLLTQASTTAAPALFLTPPTEVLVVTSGRRGGSCDANAHLGTVEEDADRPSAAKARHSFDSALKRLVQAPAAAANMSLQQQKLWDSTVLDVLTPKLDSPASQVTPAFHAFYQQQLRVLQNQQTRCADRQKPDVDWLGELLKAALPHTRVEAADADSKHLRQEQQQLPLLAPSAAGYAPQQSSFASAQSALLAAHHSSRQQTRPAPAFAINNLAAQNLLAMNAANAPVNASVAAAAATGSQLNNAHNQNLRLLYPPNQAEAASSLADATALERRASDGEASYNTTQRHRASDSGLECGGTAPSDSLRASPPASPLDLSNCGRISPTNGQQQQQQHQSQHQHPHQDQQHLMGAQTASNAVRQHQSPPLTAAAVRSGASKQLRVAPAGLFIPYARPSPSLAALSSGRLLNKRKRHSLDSGNQSHQYSARQHLHKSHQQARQQPHERHQSFHLGSSRAPTKAGKHCSSGGTCQPAAFSAATNCNADANTAERTQLS